MKVFRCGAVLFCTLLLSASAWAEAKVNKLTFDFAGKSRTCYYFIPGREGPMPAVMLLHGSGRNGQIMADLWKDLAAREGFIIVAPDSFSSEGWVLKDDLPDFLHAAVGQVNAKHAIDQNRIYLFGHSSGAEYALLLAILDSHYFAAIAIHAGALQPANVKLFAYAKRRMPIAIWVGDSDPLFPLDHMQATKQAFESNGFPVELTVVPNHDHNYYAIADLVNGSAWNFLKSKQLKP